MTMTNYNAGELLDIMRFDVEGILVECKTMFGDEMPTCQSQSHRAKRALDLIEQRQKEFRETKEAKNWDKFMRLSRMRNRLEAFLAVHETVCIMERRERDPHGLDCFGIELPKASALAEREKGNG